MNATRTFRPTPVTAKDKLLEAAVKLVRTNGFAGTSVDQLCAEAGVAKGAFFHHFASKEALGVAAADYWSAVTGAFFAGAPYHHHADPLERVLGYIDFRLDLIGGPAEAFSCVAGTLVQEAFRGSDAIRAACEASIMGNARAIEDDIAEAMALYGVTGTTAASLSRHIQTVIQGSFILAKTQDQTANDTAAGDQSREALGHLRRYFELLFNGETRNAA